uniref:Uncharacterized protein n=1 Tax=Rhodnius prolixus TaxID=13249 RepID=T1I2S2_RHOPR
MRLRMLEAIKFGLLVQALLFLLKTSQGNEETLLPKEQLNQEEDLEQCTKNSVCGIFHKRKWFNNKIQRLCKCPNTECPTSWIEGDVPLDNNSQLKVICWAIF